MGFYKYIRETWKKPQEGLGDIWKQRLIKWRREDATTRIERPTRLDRARSLGYTAKPGFVLLRQRVTRGGRKRAQFRAGRRSKHFRYKKIVDKSYQQVAEERAARKHPNCEVLNSYFVAKDGKNYWYEIILLDRAHPNVLADKKLAWVAEGQHKGRAHRGLTSSGKKSRGLLHKGKGAEHIRPSRTANLKVRKY